MRLIVARCEVVYTGRLTAVLPEALRLLMLKSDGSVMVHADTRRLQAVQNWMTPPTVIEEEPGPMVVRKRRAREDRLEIRIAEVISDVTPRHGRGGRAREGGRRARAAGAARRRARRCGEGLRLVRREWPTDIGPVDLMCRDATTASWPSRSSGSGTIDAVEQLTRYLERICDRARASGAAAASSPPR